MKTTACLGSALALLLVAATPRAGEARGVLLVGNKSEQSMHALDLASGARVAEFETGIGPHEIEVSPDQRTIVVADYGAAQSGNTLTVVDWPSRKRVRTIDLGRHARPHGMRFLADGRRLVVTTEGSGSLTEVDIVEGKVLRAIKVGDGMPHMVATSPGGDRAYVTQLGGGVLSVIDLRNGTKLADIATGPGAEGVAVTRDGKEIWVGNRADDSVSVIDAESLQVIATLASKGFPIRVTFTPDDRHALVTNAKAATLAVFERSTRRQVASVVLDESGASYKPSLLGNSALPIGARVDPDGRRVYVAISGGDQVAVIDTRSWRVVARWDSGREPDALAVVLSGPAH